MQLSDALPLLQASCGQPFRTLLTGHEADLRTNKGNVGQLLLLYIGLKLDSQLTDFDDGELKTNKADPSGLPRETMFITQLSKNIDSYIGKTPTPFEQSNFFKKVQNLVYLPVVKDAPACGDWYFTQCIHTQASPGTPLFHKLKEDYHAICLGLRKEVESSADGFIHTTNGPNYVQVRSKDSKPYHPIFSTHYDRYVSNKNHALYFMKSFMIDALSGRL